MLFPTVIQPGRREGKVVRDCAECQHSSAPLAHRTVWLLCGMLWWLVWWGFEYLPSRAFFKRESVLPEKFVESGKWLEFSPRKISVSKSPGCGRFIGSAGDRTSPSGNGAQSARITARMERLGNTFRTIMRARAPTAGAKTALPASATAIN